MYLNVLDDYNQNQISNAFSNPLQIEAPQNKNLSTNDDLNTIDANQPRSFGRTIPFLFIKGEPLCVLGPSWHYFIITFSLTLLLFILIFEIKVRKHLNILFQSGYIASFLVYVVNYLMLILKNPGIPTDKRKKLSEIEDISQYAQCRFCHCIFNNDSGGITFHCNKCEVCVEFYGHHCPFSTKCVARKNEWNFTVFLITLPLFIIMSIISLVL